MPAYNGEMEKKKAEYKMKQRKKKNMFNTKN